MLVYCVMETKEIPFSANPEGLEGNIFEDAGNGQRYLTISNLITIHLNKELAEQEADELATGTDLNYIVVERQLVGAKNYTIKLNLGELDITAE